MTYYDTTWYCNAGNQATTGYYALAKRPQNAAVVAGQICRQFTAPAAGSERCFVCIIAGTTANVTDATWVLTRGSKTVDGTVTWMECTGLPGLNGDAVNTPTWNEGYAIGGVPALGAFIKRNSGTSYHICTTAGSWGANEPPGISDVPGSVSNQGTAVWTCLGPIGNFTGGQAPFARVTTATSSGWFVAGQTIFVGNNHAETLGAQINIQPLTAQNLMSRIICFNAAGSYPPTSATTGATMTTTSLNAILIAPAGSGGPLYIYGIEFHCGVGQTSQVAISIQHGGSWVFLDNCMLDLATTGTTGLTVINIGQGTHGVIIFNNTQVKFGHTAQRLSIAAGTFIWQNGNQQPALAPGSAVPVNFMVNNTGLNSVLLEGLDLSLLDGTSTIWTGISSSPGNVLMKDCKLHPAVTVAGLATLNNGVSLQSVSSASDAAPYKSARYTNEGSEVTETVITRDGGAQDPTGQKQSRKITPNSNAQWLKPFNAEPYAVWNDRIGTVTLTVCGLWGGGAAPLTDEVWLDVEYHGSAATPIGSIIRTTKANVLAAGTPLPADASNWGGAAARMTTFDAPLVYGSGSAVLSNGNLTITGVTTLTCLARSTTLVSGGKYYFEMTNTVKVTGTGDAAGVILSGGILSEMLAGSKCVAVLPGGATYIYTNNVSTGISFGAAASGDVYSFALDLTSRLAWVRKNGGNWNGSGTANPATGVGGLSILAGPFAPAISLNAASGTGQSWTANFGQSAYAFGAPAGFLNWDTAFSPFKLVATLSSPQVGMAGYIHARPRVAKVATVYLDPQINLS